MFSSKQRTEKRKEKDMKEETCRWPGRRKITKVETKQQGGGRDRKGGRHLRRGEADTVRQMRH